MKWFWIYVLVSVTFALCRSDAAKLKSWHGRDETDLILDRLEALLILPIAIWQLYVTWWAR